MSRAIEVSGMTHGDDFVLTGPTARVTDFEKKWVYPIKAKLISYGSTESIIALHRKLHWRRRGIVYHHDPRHVGQLVKDLGPEQGNSVRTPAMHDVTDEEPEPLDQVQHSKHKSQVARCLFLSQDREDITFIVSELCQKMSNPTQKS